MGILVLGMSQLILLLHFPPWGSILCAPDKNISEEDYYLDEYTEDEIAQGLANPSIVFAEEAKSQRGRKRLMQEKENKDFLESQATCSQSGPVQGRHVQITQIGTNILY